MSGGHIHEEHPFTTPADLRDPARRLRGRLVAPVTVLTAGSAAGRTGLTVSSLLVAEGEPSRVIALVGETTDLWHALADRQRFVVQVLEEADREIADRFAGLRPSPGGLFAGLEVEDTPWGPRLARTGNWAYCTVEGAVETGFHRLVTGVVDQIRLAELAQPLVYFRGRYRALRPPRGGE